ncbi:tRNA pseudouridine(38/39) synthase [Escovopsis weberi]|uniref:tRNA pseudouridine(38/39) synthase n=1 Tax=Escovopsis weberi TaxID=150374 RepID=A0A0M9VW99_ESCWE|nr:tRNA pseudouridine(38/39) synthase [Escovopsis weberi]
MRPCCLRIGSHRIASPVTTGFILGGGATPRRASSSPSPATKNLDVIRRARGGRDMPDQTANNYNSWTKLGLIQRVKELENQLRAAAAAAAPQTQPAPAEEPCEREEAADGERRSGAEDAAAAAAAAPPEQEAKKPKAKRKMDPSRYSTRYIALKFAYLGKNYGGFEFQAVGNQPSIEEELWNALTKTCLIFPEDERVVDFDCCEYSKCGRTDRGVSAFGQVVGLRVRSNRPLPKKRVKLDEGAGVQATAESKPGAAERDGKQGEQGQEGREKEEDGDTSFDPINDEIPYPHVLNRILPKDIRILAWCPAPPPGFSARFSCRERQYRYFFTQPAFGPAPSHLEAAPARGGMAKPGWLDIDAMRDAAKRYEGEHDFRNLCKIDPAKQITNFRRRIFESDIVEVADAASALPYLRAAGYAPEALFEAGAGAGSGTGAFPRVYYFHVRGSAFLWHQIRHMVAVLFLVGQGLEAPSLVSQLLDVERTPRRPNYVMADEVPLVLWDCVFPADLDETDPAAPRVDALPWVYVGDDAAARRHGQFGVMDDAWQTWREKKMDEVLAGQLLQHIAQQDLRSENSSSSSSSSSRNGAGGSKASNSVKVFEGGNSGRMGGKYVGVMKMKMLESAEEQNDKYAKRKGYASAEDMRRQKGMT